MIRFAKPDDCAAMLAIYAPYIETTITFEQEVPSQQEFAARLETVQQEYPWIVWEEDGKILGYAYAHKFAERISYRPSAELSVYLDRAARGRGDRSGASQCVPDDGSLRGTGCGRYDRRRGDRPSAEHGGGQGGSA